jgi:hypothetical protein
MPQAKSGGGINMNKVVHTNAPKQEPKPHGVSVGAVSRMGGALGVGSDFKPLYSKQPFTTPLGTTPSVPGPGGGRMIMPSGSQSKTPNPTPMSGPRRSLFK